MCEINVKTSCELRDWMHSLSHEFKSLDPNVKFENGLMTNIDCFVRYRDMLIRFNINDLTHYKLTAEVWNKGVKVQVKALVKNANLCSHNCMLVFMKSFAQNKFTELYSL